MAVNLYTGSPTVASDHVFNRLGRGEEIVNDVNDNRGTTIPAEVDDFTDLFEAQEQLEAEGIHRAGESYKIGNEGLLSAVRATLRNSLIEQVDRDATMDQKTLQRALKTIIVQMIGAGSKSAPTTAVEKRGWTVAASAGSGNTGDSVLIVSKQGPDAIDNEYLFAETIKGRVTSKTGQGTTTFTETLTVTGAPIQSNKFHIDWPAGSGVSTTLTSINPVGTGGTQLVTNGGFDTYTTANTPDDWTIVNGAAGTDILEETIEKFSGSSSVEFASDGSTLTLLRQKLFDPANSINKISAHEVLAVFFKYKQSAESTGSGTFTLRLVDGAASPAVINDDAGNALKIDIDTTASGATAAFINQSAFFNLPAVLPSVVQVEIGYHTDPPDSGILSYVDHLIVSKATELYRGGIWAQFISGVTEGSLEDTQDISVTKNDDEGGSGNSTGLLQLAADRFWDIGRLEDPDDPKLTLRIPSVTDGSPEIPDTAIE